MQRGRTTRGCCGTAVPQRCSRPPPDLALVLPRRSRGDRTPGSPSCLASGGFPEARGYQRGHACGMPASSPITKSVDNINKFEIKATSWSGKTTTATTVLCLSWLKFFWGWATWNHFWKHLSLGGGALSQSPLPHTLLVGDDGPFGPPPEEPIRRGIRSWRHPLG